MDREKVCTGCKLPKSFLDFHKSKKSKDGHARYCKQCMSVMYVNCRHNKLDHYKKIQADRNAITRLRLQKWKQERGCLYCKESDPCCLDLHHLDPSIKEGHPSEFVKYSWKRLMKEASKCIVVCRNCHTKIHAGVLSDKESGVQISPL